ncbi:MAG TPA: DsbC family protein [Burkholderiaceae bacterium]
MRFTYKQPLLAALTLFAACTANSENAATTEANIKKLIEPKLNGVKVDSIKATPYAGLYEIRANGDIIYTDKKAEYLIIGHVFNAKTSEDLTKARIDEIQKIKFSDLPLADAVKFVKGDGKRVMAIFEDPNCGYCKRFRKETLHEMDNITVYSFLYNILSEDSTVKSRDIWCAKDRDQAWDDWMVLNKPAPTAPANCANPNDRVLALGRKLRINGTPAIFFQDGTRVAGAIDAKAVEAKLASLK